MNIALDWDLTFTADEPFWRKFIAMARESGHKVWIVTCRLDTEENWQDLMGHDYPISPVTVSDRTGLKSWQHKFTSHSPKRWFMEQQGIQIDIWIDDQPETIINGK